MVSIGAAAESIVFPFAASIRSNADVNFEVSGVSAIFARTGFKSTYMQHARIAASSRSRCALKRPSQKWPVTSSCRFAIRAIGSERAFINQEISESRLRTRRMRSESFANASTSVEVGSPNCSSIRFPGKIWSHRKATCLSDQAATTSGLVLRTTWRWFDSTAYARTSTPKTDASFSMRARIHSRRYS